MASDVVSRMDVGTPSTGTGRARLRRQAVAGPRCPHCAGPLVFGEGCSLCPICGYSGCSV